MSAPEHHEVAQLLLQKREDFSAAQVLAATENQVDHVVEIPRSHDIGYLIERLEDGEGELSQAVLTADWLTPWGVLFRYDDDPAVSLDRDRALGAASAAIGFAEQIFGN